MTLPFCSMTGRSALGRLFTVGAVIVAAAFSPAEARPEPDLVTTANSGAVTLNVPGSANPFLAGAKDGTTAACDTAPGTPPFIVTPPKVPGLVTPGAQETFYFYATGATDHGGGAPAENGTPDGATFFAVGPDRGISGCTYPLDALVGVFLNDQTPSTSDTPPPSLDFSPAGNVPGGVNYTTISPKLRQIFFIGDGFTDEEVGQKIKAPAGATRLFLASTDGCGWFNNTGQFDVLVAKKPITIGPPPPEHGGLSATFFTINGSDQPAANLADTVLHFAAQQSGRPAKLSVRVQATTTPGNEGSWTDLATGLDGYMSFDSAAPQFILNTKNYPTKNGVYFRSISAAQGYKDSISNVVGPFDLASGVERAGKTLLQVIRNGLRADLDFRANQIGGPGNVALRVQSSSKPADESSWSDIADGNSGRLTRDPETGVFALATNAVPPAKGIYFRAVAAAGGFADSLSNIIGPYSVKQAKAPTVSITSPANSGTTPNAPFIIKQNASGVAAISLRATAKAAPNRSVKSLSLLFDGQPVATVSSANQTASIDYKNNVSAIGDHVIEAIAFDDLGATARAGTGPVYVRILPRTTAASEMSDGAGKAAAPATLGGRVYHVVQSGGFWNNPSTWQDTQGVHGIPGPADFAIIGSATIRFDFDSIDVVGSASLDGGHLVGPGFLGIRNMMTIYGGSCDDNMNLATENGGTFELLNTSDFTFTEGEHGTGALNNAGNLYVHGAGGLRGVSDFRNRGAVIFLDPLVRSVSTSEPGARPARDLRGGGARCRPDCCATADRSGWCQFDLSGWRQPHRPGWCWTHRPGWRGFDRSGWRRLDRSGRGRIDRPGWGRT